MISFNCLCIKKSNISTKSTFYTTNPAASAAPEASEASEVVLNIDTASFEALKGMGAFEGVTYSSSTEGGVVSVRLSQQEFEKFQAKQGSGVSIGECDARVYSLTVR